MRRSLVLAVMASLAMSPAAIQDAVHESHVPPARPKFGERLRAAMEKMHHDMGALPSTQDADRDFLAMMIPHHQGAVEMARLLLIYGRDPLVRQLAEEIIASQQAELGSMRARLERLEKGPDPEPGGFPALSGARGQ